MTDLNSVVESMDSVLESQKTLLETPPTRPACIVTLANDAPSSYNTTIVGAAVSFVYSDASECLTENKSLNIRSGHSYDFLSQTGKCVKRAAIAFVVTIPNEGAHTFTGQANVPNPDCLAGWRPALVVNGIVKDDDDATAMKLLSVSS